jgi:hypothetical protein
MGLTRTAARELARFDVRVNAFMPTAYTRMIDEIPEERRPFTREEMPPEKVGPMVAYLMSDGAEDITGMTIRAAGDGVGLVSDPEIHRLGFQEGGWSPEEIDEKFRSTVAGGIDLDRSGSAF